MILMPQIFDVIVNENARYKLNKLECIIMIRMLVLYLYTVKRFLFLRTFFLCKLVRAERHENKIIANNPLYKDYRRRYGKS